MKRIIFIALLAAFAINLSAQKTVRKSIRRGNKAFNEQRYGAAETDYAKAMEENAASKEASFNLANTYYKQQRYDEAIKEYKHYLTLEAESPEKMSSAWSNIGNTFLKKKAGEKGQQQAQGGQPQQQQADNLQQSMEAYKNALRLNPTDDETRENLAIVQKMIKDQEDGGGDGDDDKDKNQDKDKKEEDKKEDQQNQDKNQDKQDQQKENQMSEQNIQQILQAIEQDERDTQDKVNQLKADERKKQSERNRQQNKDW